MESVSVNRVVFFNFIFFALKFLFCELKNVKQGYVLLKNYVSFICLYRKD